jgi:hypothetical protein
MAVRSVRRSSPDFQFRHRRKQYTFECCDGAIFRLFRTGFVLERQGMAMSLLTGAMIC